MKYDIIYIYIMAYPKEEVPAMADKCKEDYKWICRNNGINYELKEAQRARRFKTRMASLTCPGCNKELRVSSLKRHQTLHCKAKIPDAI